MESKAGQLDPESGQPVVLVVEDDALIRMYVSDELRVFGFKVVEAGNADEAIALLSSDLTVDLVFSDIMMPGQRGGLSLAGWVLERRPGTPIILASADRVAASYFSVEHGIPFLAKPYDIERLVKLIRDKLGLEPVAE